MQTAASYGKRPYTVSSTGDETSSSERTVIVYSPLEGPPSPSHERTCRAGVARKLAALCGYAYADEYDPTRSHAAPAYFVPGRTLNTSTAAALGVHGEADLFGGVVPYPFIGTKAITHPLIAADADAPRGWCEAFPNAVADSVLAGYTVFNLKDARTAGLQLLAHGSMRVKPAAALGGRGQTVVHDAGELDAALSCLEASELALYGLVLEQNLVDVVTHSVGHVRVGGLTASYYGTQCLTPDNSGAEVYGGSQLVVARGGFDALLALDLPEAAQLAIRQARAYDAAADQCFHGFYASRRNYDIAQGCYEGDGTWHCGVLEQSWRIGGASSAEVGALEAFRADPSLRAVHAASVELYGDNVQPPPDATIYFTGLDEEVGLITKYATVHPYAHAR
jgi:hypothetical protein